MAFAINETTKEKVIIPDNISERPVEIGTIDIENNTESTRYKVFRRSYYLGMIFGKDYVILNDMPSTARVIKCYGNYILSNERRVVGDTGVYYSGNGTQARVYNNNNNSVDGVNIVVEYYDRSTGTDIPIDENDEIIEDYDNDR